MIIGQTVFSVRRGTEHRAEAALDELARGLGGSEGLVGFRVLRSVGMSPLASDLCEVGREATLCDMHYVVQTEWETIETHDDFYGGDFVRSVYALLKPCFASGPYEILYETKVQQREASGVIA
jgi:hypothetical protein